MKKPFIPLLIILLVLLVILYNISYKIPKIAYSYWDKNTPPIIERIIEERRQTMPDWKIILLTDETLGNYINLSSVPVGYEKLKPQHQADWIRLKLLEKYGGLWLDSSIIINDSAAINEIYDEACKSRVDVAAFSMNKPVPEKYIENWFIMAPVGSSLIKKWLTEYEKAISMGFMEYRNHVEKMKIPISNDIYAKEHKSVYLTQHACLQVVLSDQKAKVLLYPAERNMFKVQETCKWKYKCIIDTISNDPQVNELPFIKLRGGEKTIDYEKYFARARVA
jgi:hypothetical protein